MSTAVKLVVDLVGIGLIALVVWFFWLSKKEGTRAVVTADGVQEALIVVKGGYSPDTIVVDANRPVRLKFRREEASPCSEMVVFGDFNIATTLPTGQTVAVDLRPTRKGEYPFTCQMGMLRGKLVVQ